MVNKFYSRTNRNMRAFIFALSILTVCCASAATAQQSNFYYEHQTRYGTFRHYENGGAVLVSGRNYAGEIAAAQQEGQRMTEERQRQRQIELERMRKAQYPNSNTNQHSVVKNYGPTPADIARREQEEKDAIYRQYEELLDNAKNLSDQSLVLNEMQRMRPSDSTALRLFGVYAQLANEERMAEMDKSLSASFHAANRDVIRAGYGAASYRKARYDYAIHYLDQLETPDLNSFTENLCSRIRLRRWTELQTTFAGRATSFPELLPVADNLAAAFNLLENGQAGTATAKNTAADLYRFAVARRESRIMDCVNILALDTAVELDPENSSYREERFNSNSILKLKHAMEEDYEFFNK